MATPRLFKLKAEVAPATSGPKASVLPIARIRVDTGVFHLDQLYDYLIPERLSAQVSLGVRVQLPFGNRETEGIVVDRVELAERAGELKSITKVLSSHPIASLTSLQLIDEVAEYYASNPWDVIRSAIPPRVASVDKAFTAQSCKKKVTSASLPVYKSLEPFVPVDHQVVDLIVENLSFGSVLVIAPDEKDVDRIFQSMSESPELVLKLTAAMPRDERYRNFLLASTSERCIVVGTRSAVFAPVCNLGTLIVHKESAFDHFEVRSPGWNSREVAFIRSGIEDIRLVFTGFSPSMELAAKIDERKVKYLSTRQTVAVKAFTPTDGALLPGRIFSDIRKAVSKGPVLFIAPRKGYGNALLCAHCKNIALCECGGRLSVVAKTAPPSCSHCGKRYDSWKCSFCNRDRQYLSSRGIDRAAEEIARAFPNIPVVISAGDVIKTEVDAKPSLVLATPGSQPNVEGGYSAVVILDGIRFFSHTDFRSQERARELFLESAALISSGGSVLLVIDDSHPITASIARWNVAPLIKREMSERTELLLPPMVSSAVLVLSESEAMNVISGLKKALLEKRLPGSVRIYGPTPITKGQVKIVLHVAHEEFAQLRNVLHELQRRRSIAKKELFTLRINPYSL